MISPARRLAATFWLITASTCLGGTHTPGPERKRPLWVVSNGFHSGVVLEMADAGPFVRSTTPDPRAKRLMIGWGERGYYMATKKTLGVTLAAIFWPSPSALNVIPVHDRVEKAFPRSEIVRFDLSAEQFATIRRYLEEQFARDREGRAVFLGNGLSPRSAFFLGSENFYFPKMCNMWVARALRQAGIRISPAGSITAQELMRQARREGTRTGGLRRELDVF